MRSIDASPGNLSRGRTWAEETPQSWLSRNFPLQKHLQNQPTQQNTEKKTVRNLGCPEVRNLKSLQYIDSLPLYIQIFPQKMTLTISCCTTLHGHVVVQMQPPPNAAIHRLRNEGKNPGRPWRMDLLRKMRMESKWPKTYSPKRWWKMVIYHGTQWKITLNILKQI